MMKLIRLLSLLIITLAQFAKPDSKPSNELRIPIYSYYSSSFKDHYLTADYSEFTTGTEIYAYDGIAFYLRQHQDETKNSVPLFLYYHGYPVYDHYYTTNPDKTPNDKAHILGYCYPENKKQDDMVALHKYYHSDKDDHLYEVVADDIIFNLAVGELREDQYEYQGVECYVFRQSLQDELNTINNNEINDYLPNDQLPKNFKELPSDLDAILNGDNNNNEDEQQQKQKQKWNELKENIKIKKETKHKREKEKEFDEQREERDERDIKYLLISSSGSNKKHGVYTFVTLIVMIGVICTIAYFYCYSKRHVDDIYDQESEPLLTTTV